MLPVVLFFNYCPFIHHFKRKSARGIIPKGDYHLTVKSFGSIFKRHFPPSSALTYNVTINLIEDVMGRNFCKVPV